MRNPYNHTEHPRRIVYGPTMTIVFDEDRARPSEDEALR